MPDLWSISKDLTAGQVAGMGQVVSGHWLDTVKVKMQTQTAGAPMYSGSLDCLRQTVKSEGVFGLFKGMLSPMLGVGLQSALAFSVFGSTGRALLERRRQRGTIGHGDDGHTQRQPAVVVPVGTPISSLLTVPELAISGAAGGLAGSWIVGPLELVKTQLQVSPKTEPGSQYVGTLKYGRLVVRDHGLRALTRGLGATALREMPANAAFFGCYSSLKRVLMQASGQTSGSPSPVVLISSAVGAGWAYWLASYPIDLVKSRIQASPFHEPAPKFAATLVAIVRGPDGVRGLFKGIGPCLLRAIPAASTTFGLYELTLSWLERFD